MSGRTLRHPTGLNQLDEHEVTVCDSFFSSDEVILVTLTFTCTLVNKLFVKTLRQSIAKSRQLNPSIIVT